jgi:hypothetical protein
LTSALVGGEWSDSPTCRFTPGERDQGYTGYEAGWALEPVWTTWRSENSCPYWDSNSDPLVVQPVASRYTDCAIPALPILKRTVNYTRNNNTSLSMHAQSSLVWWSHNTPVCSTCMSGNCPLLLNLSWFSLASSGECHDTSFQRPKQPTSTGSPIDTIIASRFILFNLNSFKNYFKKSIFE